MFWCVTVPAPTLGSHIERAWPPDDSDLTLTFTVDGRAVPYLHGVVYSGVSTVAGQPAPERNDCSVDPLSPPLGQGRSTPKAGEIRSLVEVDPGLANRAAIDPGDDCTFWYVGDYFRAGDTSYRTRIGAFRLPGCDTPKSKHK